MGKWSVINWDMGVDGVEEWWSSRDEVMAYCEDHVGCDTAACEEKNVLDHDHCERNSFHGYIHQYGPYYMPYYMAVMSRLYPSSKLILDTEVGLIPKAYGTP